MVCHSDWPFESFTYLYFILGNGCEAMFLKCVIVETVHMPCCRFTSIFRLGIHKVFTHQEVFTLSLSKCWVWTNYLKGCACIQFSIYGLVYRQYMINCITHVCCVGTQRMLNCNILNFSFIACLFSSDVVCCWHCYCCFFVLFLWVSPWMLCSIVVCLN